MDSAPSSPASPSQLSPPPPPPPTPVPLSPASAARQNRATIAAIDAQLPFGTTPAERRHKARSQIYGEVPDSEEDPDDELSDDDVEMGEATTMTTSSAIAPTNRVIRLLPIRTRNRPLLGTTPAVLHTNAEASDLEAAPAAESTAWAGDLGGMDLLLPLPTLITTADTTTTANTTTTTTTTTNTTTTTTTTTTTSTSTFTVPAQIFGGIQLPAIQFPRRRRRAGINFEIFDEEAYLEAQREEEERRNRERGWGR
ncbi:MAG: hypothetical protein LQ339_007716 [Xanthoria mediterranea]|nr:MAG: hypothetical protein LQ339_007716 [Xanthoria mediterranea]